MKWIIRWFLLIIKTIAYKRILNIGNYESKHLEITYELGEGEEPGLQISTVMEIVERKIREDQAICLISYNKRNLLC